MAKAKTSKSAKTKKTAAKTRAKASKKSPARRAAAKPARKASSRGFRLASNAPSLTVDDVARSMAWYCDVLGFAVKQRWEHEGTLLGLELQAGDVALYLSQEDGKQGDRIKGQGFRLYWYTNQDIDQIAAGIKARGGTLATEPKDEYGARSFNLIDPTGYKITISTEP